jgi:hypothetical protein
MQAEQRICLRFCTRLRAYVQTETPEQLKARNSARKPGQKAASVVERQAVAVLSRGTLMDPEMVAGHPDAAYVLAGARVRPLSVETFNA